LIPDFSKFDGSGRKPRPVQTAAFEWLSSQWATKEVLAINGPVGCGKSGIAAAIQKSIGAAIITPANILIDQYRQTYPKTNFLKGKAHYQCISGLSCADWIDVMEQKACINCPYKISKERARSGESTFFNPMSLYYLQLNKSDPSERIKTMVVDEAHQLSSYIQALSSKRFASSDYRIPTNCENTVFLSQWMAEQIGKLQRLANLYQDTGDFPSVNRVVQELESIGLTKTGLDADPQNYAIWFEQGMLRGRRETFLNVKPVRPPAFIMRRLLDAERVVIMSGTLLITDIEDLAAGREFVQLELESPIPVGQRPILYRPTSYPINMKTDWARLVADIEDHIDDYPGRNTIIHTSYERGKLMARHFTKAILTNTSANKNERLEFFKKHGGIFLAAGCSEGLDLKDDLCRLNIIPHMVRPNLGDPVVQKRKALEDGERWHALETLKTTIQQYGRSTRHEKDSSTTIVMDPQFSSMVNKYKKYLPQYFFNAIQWSA
jgi:Rad3-related DNA helicase